MEILSYLIVWGFGVATGAVCTWYVYKRRWIQKLTEKGQYYENLMKQRKDELVKDFKALKDVKADDLDDALKKIGDKIKSWV